MKKPTAEYLEGMKRVMAFLDQAVHVCEGPDVSQSDKAFGQCDAWTHVQVALARKLRRIMEDADDPA